MPLYEYQCDNCNEKFEVMQKFVDEPLTTHEKCGGGPVHRLISAPSFNFKGTGWYVTDYPKGKTPGSKSSSSESASDGPSKTSDKSSDKGSEKSSESSKDSKSPSDSSSTTSPSTPSSDTK
jgi:putative FmdB family regulatory protein